MKNASTARSFTLWFHSLNVFVRQRICYIYRARLFINGASYRRMTQCFGMSDEDDPFSCIYLSTDWSAGSRTGKTKGASDRYRLPIENSVSSPLCLLTKQQKLAHEKLVPSESISPFNYSRIAMPVLLVLYSIEQYWHEVHPNRWSLEKRLVVLDMEGKYR